MTRFTGIWPAMVTPLTEDDHVNVAMARRLVDHFIAAGVGGLYVCGSTGEGVLLPLAERKLMAETVIEQTNGRRPVIVHVGATATADAVELAAHAEWAGADAVSAVPPFYYNVGWRGIEEHYQMIAAASSLPLYLYYIPRATGVTATAAEMWQLCQIDNVRGFKFTAYDMYLLERIMALSKGRLNIFSGPDELLLPMLTLGVDGAIGSTYNLLPTYCVGLYDAFQRGDLSDARQMQSRINRVIDVLHKYGGMPAVKAAMRLLDFDCGHCRRPLRRLDTDEVAALRADLEAVGFWEMAEPGSTQ